jgi:CheY-like chemotaxis protein
MTKVNILLVDDNATFLEALEALINSVLGTKVGKLDFALDGSEAIQKINSFSYNYIFMDVTMPLMDGIKATRIATNNYKGFTIVAVSFHQEFEIIREIIEAGARYYVNKSELTHDKINRIFKLSSL